MKKNKSSANNNTAKETIIKRNCFDVNDSSINFVLSLIVPVLASVIMAILFAFFATFSGSSYEEFISTKLAMVISLIYTPVVFLLIYLIYTKKCKINVFEASEIKWKVDWKKVLVVAAIAVASVFMISPFISLLDHAYALLGYNPSNSLPYVMNNGWRYVLGVVVMAIIPAICEELLFRGLIYKGLTKKFTPHVAVIISGFMFMLLHGSMQQTVYQFLLGVMLGYAMYYGKSILFPIILHFVNNFIVVTMSFYYTMNNVDVNAPAVYAHAWDYIYPVLLFVLAAGVIVGLIYLLKFFNKNKNTVSQISESTAENSNIIISEANAQSEVNSEIKIESKKNFAALSKTEGIWFYGGIALGIIIWIVNTVVAFV